MSGPIQTYLRLLFTEASKSVSEDILPDLLSFTYDDKETNEADEISITLRTRRESGRASGSRTAVKSSELTSHPGRLVGRKGASFSAESSSSIRSAPVARLVSSRCAQCRSR